MAVYSPLRRRRPARHRQQPRPAGHEADYDGTKGLLFATTPHRPVRKSAPGWLYSLGPSARENKLDLQINLRSHLKTRPATIAECPVPSITTSTSRMEKSPNRFLLGKSIVKFHRGSGLFDVHGDPLIAKHL